MTPPLTPAATVDTSTFGDWWVVALASVLYYALGALWFSPLFGRAWDRSIGHDRTRDNSRFPVSYYTVPLLSSALVCLVIAFLTGGGGSEPFHSAVVGAAVGTAAAAASVTNALTPHTPRPFVLGTITGGYHLTASTLVGLFLGLV